MTGLIFWLTVTAVWSWALVRGSDWLFFKLPQLLDRFRS
jgi:hypothetical protein